MEYLRSVLPWSGTSSTDVSETVQNELERTTLVYTRQTMSSPLTRVELHAHMDGSVRPETVWELTKTKGLPLPGDGSLRAMKEALTVTSPVDLAHFLAPFGIIIPPLQDDLVAIERMAFEFIEDKAKDHVAYVEGRFAPHGLLSDSTRDMPHMEEVVKAVARGCCRGEEKYGVQWNLLLCTLAGWGTANEVLQLCERSRNSGVVGIDMASPCVGPSSEEVPINGEEPAVFQRAKLAGLHRTVHAGERGPALMVQRAVEIYGAQRIGHGYHVVEDAGIYDSVKKANIHLECCPHSSFLTGAVPMGVAIHPIKRFATDGANYSLSTDDPTITGYTLSEDYALYSSWGLTEAQAVRASLNAAKSAFLPETERQRLAKKILQQVVPDWE